MNNAEIRARARENLGSSLFHTDWLTAMVICIAATALLSAVSSVFSVLDMKNTLVSIDFTELQKQAIANANANTNANDWQSVANANANMWKSINWSAIGITMVIQLLIGGPIAYGKALTFLNKARGSEKYEFGDLFQGFSTCLVDCFVLNFMITLICTLWCLIPIAGNFISIYKSFGYSMAYYIKIDHPEATWRECLDRSTTLMNGHRWEYFCLGLSFIGWAFLGMFACCIGTLWVQPYYEASMANFYEARKAEREIL